MKTPQEAWKNFLRDMSDEDLFHMETVSRYYIYDQERNKSIATRAVEIPALDLSLDDQIEVMADFTESALTRPGSYVPRTKTASDGKTYERATFSRFDLAFSYALLLMATHKVTEPLESSKRADILSQTNPWNYLTKEVEKAHMKIRSPDSPRYAGNILTQEEYLAIREKEGRKSPDTYKPLLDLSSEVLRRVGVTLGGGEPNEMLRTIYSLGIKIPKDFQNESHMDSMDLSQLPKLEEAMPIKEGSPLYLSAKDYAIIRLRQDAPLARGRILPSEYKL